MVQYIKWHICFILIISAGADLSPPDYSLVAKALNRDNPKLAMYLVERGSSVLAKDYNLHGPHVPVICRAIEEGRSTSTHSYLIKPFR